MIDILFPCDNGALVTSRLVRASLSIEKASGISEAKQSPGKPALKGGFMVSLEPAALYDSLWRFFSVEVL